MTLKWLLVSALIGCQPAKPSAALPEPAQPPLTARTAPSGTAPARRQPGVTSDCVNYSTTNREAYEYQNNMWAEDKARGPFEQCVVARTQAGEKQLGWTWDWPGYEPLGFGYPEIIFGWKPWSNHSTTAELPRRIVELQSLTARYAVTTESSGKVALSLTMFVTDSNRTSDANPRAIVGEVVLWLDYPEGAVPIGTRTQVFDVAGTRYELWHTAQHGDRGDGTGWGLFYLKGPNHRLRGTIQLQPLLEYLSTQRFIQSDRFVATVELGNELMGGSGTTWVQDFEVRVNAPTSE